jgi:hypothetical protein
MMWTDGWSLEWPTEPGLYLFYGDYNGLPPKFKLCEVMVNDEGKVVGRVADGQFLYESEQVGAFRPFDEKPPPLDHMLRIANPPEVTPEQIAALIRWRERGMDQWGQEAVDKTLASLDQWSHTPPKGHEDALYAFQALNYEDQLKAVCEALGQPLPSEPEDDEPYEYR